MGLISGLLSLLFGGERNVVRETAEVFLENAESAAARSAALREQALMQFGAEFQLQPKSGFDRFMDGINRLPRPALALGTLGLFVIAMIDPLWFAERMHGIALVPEPLWWLLGVIVSFYFGARHQTKAQEFQREVGVTLAQAPKVMENLEALERLQNRSSRDARKEPSKQRTREGRNPALDDWRRLRTAE
ncbi:holin family protein [Ruegeria arenilitoris]|uniref:holin family protein n=1 Tax=Ruegeria arenilitoris TaxID=1173585 RepID=UPI00147C05F9|nr:holin family protein [Ruegeria arenilitoris]